MVMCCNCTNEIRPETDGSTPLACSACREMWAKQKRLWGLRLLMDTGYMTHPTGILIPPEIHSRIEVRTIVRRPGGPPELQIIEDQPD
ncbi:MAG: hypothetical protein Q8R28_11985 [Dehalococcoidia bacterium]|nr:hypothetical protein [Dehalococcoidia bacterium]